MDLLRGMCVLSISRREDTEDAVILHRFMSLISVKLLKPPSTFGEG